MTLSQVKAALRNMDSIGFVLPDGTSVPTHFHVTEVGLVSRNFIDCGGSLRRQTVVDFQLWTADDTDHRLGAQKLLDIIQLAEKQLQIPDVEVEVSYQGRTIERYGLSCDGRAFALQSLQTDCLAKDKCGIPEEKPKVKLSEMSQNNNCTPGGGCC